MQSKLEQLKIDALLEIKAARDKIHLEELENKFLGRKNGALTNLLKGLKDLEDTTRKTVGTTANEVKTLIEAEFAKKEQELTAAAWVKDLEKEAVDTTQPALPVMERGHLHPITLVQNDLEDLFTSMGFMVLDGPELESDYYNFEALNVSKNHPARDTQDTFYIKNHGPDTDNSWVMRTQTSPVQIRAMQKYGAPLRAIVPGKCFRNESTDARHEHTFYQLEGIVIDKDINFSHLKGIFHIVVDHLFGKGTKLRLMPKFFPFVEPGVRGEVPCFICNTKGCRVCKNTGWSETMPGGMIHPNVLKAGGIDPKVYQGFAFGLGMSRLATLKYGVGDARLFESGDLRFLKQF